MSLFLVDSHCHLDRLDLTPFDGELQGALDLAAEQGVGHMLCVCIDLEHFNDVLKPAQNHANISASVGVHPNENVKTEPTIEELLHLAADKNVVAIGETGLDYFRSEGDLDWQRERFRTHIRAAKECQKPLIIHMRDAAEDTLRILQEENAAEVGGVMHCFTENREIAQRALDLNFMISFSGIVTFNSAKELKEVAKYVPADRMLVETDSPYLAPVPFRGKPNQPAYVTHVAAHVAELRETTIEEIAQHTTENYFSLFGGRPM
ncbi:MAG: TatD family hydrolase [Gammaproteobacteria bacterium]|nr:TatD family hydrolase [Gammaproteobacteria bacterium]MDH5776737.1 TatD family hydrolase [Gammaproteobacteria bacterium]